MDVRIQFVYVCVFVCESIRGYTSVCVCACLCVSACDYQREYTCVCVCVSVCACERVSEGIYKCVWVSVCVCVSERERESVCVCVMHFSHHTLYRKCRRPSWAYKTFLHLCKTCSHSLSLLSPSLRSVGRIPSTPHYLSPSLSFRHTSKLSLSLSRSLSSSYPSLSQCPLSNTSPTVW